MKNLEIILEQVNAPEGINIINKKYQYRLSIVCRNEIVKNTTVCIQPPMHVEPFEYTEVDIEELLPGNSMEIGLNYTFLCGGRHVFYMWEKNKQLNTLSKFVATVSGAGYYSGNTHSHSVYSDGKSTLFENRISMMESGHSFTYATDHNTTEHFKELEEYVEEGKKELFLHIRGWEYTTAHGHAIAYGSQRLYDKDHITDLNRLDEWQDFVDEMNNNQAVVYLAHPYEAPRFEFGDEVLMNIEGIAGIEVWNGWDKDALCYETRKSYELWDALNRKGTAHYMGNAVSDAHTKESQSSPFIKGYMDMLTEENVQDMLKNGRYIGSNGPELELTIGSTGVGESYESNGKETLLHITAFDPTGNIESVNIYVGNVDKECTNKANTTKRFVYYPLGESEKRLFSKSIYLKVKPGEFYRADVFTSFGVVPYMADNNKIEKGYAFTNPIWIL